MAAGGPSALLVEVPTDVAVEPLEERTETTSPSFLSVEQTRSMRSEDLSRRLVKELMLSEAILEQIIAKVGGTIEDILEVPEPPPSEEEVRSEVAMKTSEEVPKALEIAFPDYL